MIGPARFTEMPCQIEDIPIVDAVVISHSHYDHLSHPTIMKIKERHPNVHFFVPLGLKVWFEKSGIDSVTELDWWQSTDIRLRKTTSDKPARKEEDIEVVSDSEGPSRSGSSSDIVATIGALPCQHQSGRGPFDRNQTLWASWSVESGGKKLWFAGYEYLSVHESLLRTRHQALIAAKMA